MTTSKKTQAPSKINMIAPVALVLIGYTYMLHSPQQAKLRKESSRLENLVKSQQDTEDGLMDTLQAQAKLKTEMRELEKTLASEETSLTNLLAHRSAMRQVLLRPSRPAATMQEVTRLFGQHRLRVIESTPEKGSQRQAEAALEPLLKLLADKNASNPNQRLADSVSREVYRMKLRGRFEDLRLALEKLGLEQDQVIPLSVEMEPLELEAAAVKSSLRTWILQIMV